MCACSAVNAASAALEMEARTSTEPKRIIYFKGHKDQPRSALITQVCRDYETVSALLRGESATRTLLNLYNLHACRGALEGERLVFRTSMSGPHHYFGWVDPRKHHVIVADGTGAIEYRQLRDEDAARVPRRALRPLAAEQVLRITEYEWMPGTAVDAATRAAYAVRDELQVHLVDTDEGTADSLFDDPGILVLETREVRFPLVVDPHLFDLSPFHAQIVRNDQPFAFDQELVERFAHAQHKLRVVTYNYGDDYVPGYLMHGSGIFIERHEFIQAITPMTRECGGFVMLGREVVDDAAHRRLELVACPVPFGYTLLVDVGAIHGDSTLTGLYMMAMTGNHNAMRTADTVFLKHRATRGNVAVATEPALPAVPGLPGDRFLLTSDARSLEALRVEDEAIKARILASVGTFKSLWWHPVVATGTDVIGWTKTHGSSLPEDD